AADQRLKHPRTHAGNDLRSSNMGSSDDTEKMIQRLNEELQEAQERADTERQKNVELKGLLEEERKDNRQQVEESAKQIQHLQGQLQQLQDEVDAYNSARDEITSLKHALKSAAADRERDVSALQADLANASSDLDKWRQTASKYEHDVKNLPLAFEQQSKQWQKTAEIQAGALQSVQEECYGLQKECALLRSEKQDLVNKQQKEKNALQSECAALRRDKEELQSEREATVQKQHQLEKELSSLISQNAELSSSLKSLESSQQELEKTLVTLQNQYQQDKVNWQSICCVLVQFEEAEKELSTLKEKCEKMEQEQQSLTEELEQCKANMKDMEQKETTVSV
uniref:Sarcolemma associated protein b n=1 Tax=Cynoglossus semilaevis TaxID=244447 RepID=A0A3P8X5B6_CYNSE